MEELIAVMVKRPHEKTNNKENTKAKIEATVYAVARFVP
jgi:hypothetical protein